MSFIEKHDTFNKKSDDVKRLNIGSGDTPLDGYVNLDMHSAKADIKQDFFEYVRNNGGNEFDEVLASHILEHIPRPRSLEFLGGMLKVLKPGGLASIVVPDFDFLAECWVKYQDHWRWVDLHMKVYGNQINDGQYHKSAWNADKLGRSLKAVGFVEIWTAYSWDHDCRTVLATGRKPLKEVVQCQNAECGEFRKILDGSLVKVEV